MWIKIGSFVVVDGSGRLKAKESGHKVACIVSRVLFFEQGVTIEFDHEKLASILGIPGNNGICEYVKDVWEESKYIKPLEITRRRRDDAVDVSEGEAEEEAEGNKDDFDWEAVIDEATVEGESCSGEKFYDAEDKD
ncbi:hypothetical protein Dimus_021973 [Dionaea muscipula]